MRAILGHTQGFDKLSETTRWCIELGIKMITVYVFSIENFKRSKEEVEGLMQLAKKMFAKLLKEGEEINRDGVCIEIFGDWSLIPPDLKQLMAKAMIMTRNNTKLKINVAFAYTARNEMVRGIHTLVDGVVSAELQMNDLSEKLLEDAFQTHPPRKLDLLVRTSGETRLSDFLLWQSSETVLCFTDVLWPELKYWHLLGILLEYQSNCVILDKLNVPSNDTLCYGEADKRKNKFLETTRDEHWSALKTYSENINPTQSRSV